MGFRQGTISVSDSPQKNKQKRLANFKLSVNISVRQLTQPDIHEKIADILKKNNFPANNLILELTETVLMENLERTIENLKKIAALNVSIAIDDFGTGYSSMAYLKTLPFAFLKIDKSFIDDIGKDANNEAIVKGIINLAATMNLSVIAEGVETSTQQDFLKENHCDYAQGFYYYHPLRLSEFFAFLAKDN